jgi:BirA family transcriptional regulator, biotin operon repressor / biotin---[acetyl-CoA-carboxylase] ligase
MSRRKAVMQFQIHHYETVSSTNDLLKAMSEAPEFTVVVADEQTAGRGRRSRSWHSAAGDGLYLSLLLCPRSEKAALSLLSLATAISLAETIREIPVRGVDIKWPNDLLIHDHKVGGILIEGSSTGAQGARVIVGIGVNLNSKTFPAELEETATSLFLESGRLIDAVQFRDALLARIAEWYAIWSAGENTSIIRAWEALSSYARGRMVHVTTDDGEMTGETCGLADDGALVLRTAAGKEHRIIAGEVSRLRAGV